MGYDFVVAGRAWFDDLAGDFVGVDDGEVVRGGGENLGDGGFAGCDAAGQSEEEHS